MNERTENEVTNSITVRHPSRPRQLALGEELDAGDRECVHVRVHLLREAVVSARELWSLPSKRPICNRPGVSENDEDSAGQETHAEGVGR